MTPPPTVENPEMPSPTVSSVRQDGEDFGVREKQKADG